MSSTEPLRIAVQLTLGEIYRACFIVPAKSKQVWKWGVSGIKNVLYASALFFVLCLVLCKGDGSHSILVLRSLFWGVLFFAAFMPAMLLILPPVILGVMALRGMLPRKPTTYLFFDDRIECQVDTSVSAIQWSSLTMILETRSQFLLYYRKYNALLLPKRCFAGDSEIQELQRIIRAHGTGRIEIRS